MAKQKKHNLKEHTGDNLHIEFPRWISANSFIKTTLILRPTTSISIFGDNPAFEWEGKYGDEVIKVTIPRHVSERDAVITGKFPNEIDQNRGTTSDQLYAELRRVLRQLD